MWFVISLAPQQYILVPDNRGLWLLGSKSLPRILKKNMCQQEVGVAVGSRGTPGDWCWSPRKVSTIVSSSSSISTPSTPPSCRWAYTVLSHINLINDGMLHLRSTTSASQRWTTPTAPLTRRGGMDTSVCQIPENLWVCCPRRSGCLWNEGNRYPH